MTIHCWYCNSLLDPYCSDPFDNSTANKKDCSIENELPHLRGVPAKMCRKIRMKGKFKLLYMMYLKIKADNNYTGDPCYLKEFSENLFI